MTAGGAAVPHHFQRLISLDAVLAPFQFHHYDKTVSSHLKTRAKAKGPIAIEIKINYISMHIHHITPHRIALQHNAKATQRWTLASYAPFVSKYKDYL